MPSESIQSICIYLTESHANSIKMRKLFSKKSCLTMSSQRLYRMWKFLFFSVLIDISIIKFSSSCRAHFFTSSFECSFTYIIFIMYMYVYRGKNRISLEFYWIIEWWSCWLENCRIKKFIWNKKSLSLSFDIKLYKRRCRRT